MARLQTKSGGFDLDPTIRYSVYASLTSLQTTAIIDTEPEELPEGYSSWLEGSGHELTVIDDALGMTASVGQATVAVQLVVAASVTGNVLTVNYGNLYVSLPGAPAGELPDEGMIMIMSKWMGN